MASKSTNTGQKQESRRGKNEATIKAQFKKGYDPRRNLKGRPASFDEWRKMAIQRMQTKATNQQGKPLIWDGQEITVAEFIQLTWAMDKKQQEKLVEAAYGKVSQPVEIHNDDSGIYKNLLARLSGMVAGKAENGTPASSQPPDAE